MNEPNELRTLGLRLARIREGRGLTQVELCERIRRQTGDGLSVSYLSRLERGQGGAKALDLIRLARALGVTVAELLGETADVHLEAGQQLLREPWLLEVFARLQVGIDRLPAAQRARLRTLLEVLADLHGEPLPATSRDAVGMERG